MAVFNEPTKWQTSLVNSGDANVIPQSTPAGTGKASFKDGFPQITQIPLSAGGQAPDRKDFNGLFKVLGDWIFFNQNGGVPTYSESFDYVAGRVVSYNDNIYKCIQANGASSTVVAPDSISPLGSDYWVQVSTLADFTNFANKDFSNVSAPVQAFKDMSIGWGMPDYSSGINIGSNFATLGGSWTAPSDGFIEAIANTPSSPFIFLYTQPNSNISSNDNVFLKLSFSGSDSNASSTIVPILKGQTVYQTSQSPYYFRTAQGKITFYPCKGAN